MRRLPAIVVVAILLPAGNAAAQPSRQVRNPPEATVRRTGPGPLAAAKAPTDKPAASLALRVVLTTATIRNPSTGQFDKVQLRAYQSDGADTGSPLVAPTIRANPGEIVRLTIQNTLEPEDGCEKSPHNTPHCFNSTNIHSHGLWVSPEGQSDNVFVTIKPNDTYAYAFEIPAEHPAGTFWYHPHLHGSTALQVGSGMAGALIVQGSRLPSAQQPGDIDTLLKHTDGAAFKDRIMVLQQIPYACRDEKGFIKLDKYKTWRCDPEDVGAITKYTDQLNPPSAWKNSGRFTTVNGLTVEPLQERGTVGRIERWRFIHAGVRATIKLQFRKRVLKSLPFENVAAGAQDAWIDANCDAKQVVPHWQAAADGLTLPRLMPRDSIVLQPGYRSDLLVVFPSAGDYCVIDEAAPEAQSVNSVAANRQLLTMVSVDGDGTIADLKAHLTAELKAAAKTFMPDGVRDQVLAGLDGDLGLASFAPHGDLRNTTPTGTQSLFFSASLMGVGTNAKDVKPFDPMRTDRTLTLGAIEDWVLATEALGAPHPFHIHVNPFQILSITGAGGQELTQVGTSQYFGLQGVWKDTLSIEADVTAKVRTEYRRFKGAFVLHCHILDHEDRGMMQRIEIVEPKPPAPSLERR